MKAYDLVRSMQIITQHKINIYICAANEGVKYPQTTLVAAIS